MIREQRYKAGGMLNIDILPFHEKRYSDNNSAARKTSKSAEQIQAENIRKQIKIAIRKANATFGNQDYFCHFTFTPENSPQTKEEAESIFKNFIRRLKYHRRKQGLSELAVMYGIHNEPYKSGTNRGLPRYHYHCLITGNGMSMNDILKIWSYSTMNKIDYYRPDIYGPEKAVRYICDKPAGNKLYYCTQNLKEPRKRKPIDGKLTREAVERMAQDHQDDAKFWERRYKGYKFWHCDSVYNEISGQWYISVYMYKKPDRPKKNNSKRIK